MVMKIAWCLRLIRSFHRISFLSKPPPMSLINSKDFNRMMYHLTKIIKWTCMIAPRLVLITCSNSIHQISHMVKISLKFVLLNATSANLTMISIKSCPVLPLVAMPMCALSALQITISTRSLASSVSIAKGNLKTFQYIR